MGDRRKGDGRKGDGVSERIKNFKQEEMLIKKIDSTHMEVKMYGNIGGWFVDGENFTSILDDFEAAGVREATFRMHCYGGSVFEGSVIGNAFARSKMKINIVIDGIAASMACMVLPYVAAENIQIAENGFGMLHRPATDAGGNADAHLAAAKLLGDMEANIIRTLAERTGLGADAIRAKFFDGADHWLNADEMVQYRLAGSKVKSVASIAALDRLIIENMTEEFAYGHFAASLDTAGTFKNNNKNNLGMKKELIEGYKLTGVTAESSDTAVLAALREKTEATEQRLATMEGEAKSQKDGAIKAMLDVATKEGKIGADKRGTYEAIGQAAGTEALATVLAEMGKKTPIVQMLQGGGTGSGSGERTWAWYQANAAKELEAMPEADPERFKELYKAEFGE